MGNDSHSRRKQWDARAQQYTGQTALMWYPAIDPWGEGCGRASPELLCSLNQCDYTDKAWGHLKRPEFVMRGGISKEVREDTLSVSSPPGNKVKWTGWLRYTEPTTRLSIWGQPMWLYGRVLKLPEVTQDLQLCLHWVVLWPRLISPCFLINTLRSDPPARYELRWQDPLQKTRRVGAQTRYQLFTDEA